MPPPARDQVFISYIQKDRKWCDDLDTHLKPYLRDGSITSWSDQQIAPGSQWFTEIESALTNSKIGVLLVSPDFLASDFIHEHELGSLLKKAEEGGVRILWVPVRDSAYKQTPLKNYQAVLDPGKALAAMTKAKRDQAWVKICEEIQKAANSGADKPVCDVEALRPSFKKESDLAGSTPLQNRPLVEWKWSIGGFVLLLFAFALGLWGSSLGSPSEDQRSLLAWALSLASGCSAGAFAASLSARTRHWFPGILITGSVGFVGWLMTFFYLFPEPTSKTLDKATKSRPWVNSLGMRFVPVGGTQVLFSIWDTRVKDLKCS
jgi:TIR domain